MNIDEKWEQKYQEVMLFMATHQRRPSKHRIEEHKMLNWIKHNKKQFSHGEMPIHRQQQFKQLLQTAQKYQRINQYAYTCSSDKQLLLPFQED